MDKLYVSANELLDDSYRLAHQIHKSGFEPDYVVAVWRGGTPVGIAIQEYLGFVGIETDHCAMRTISYIGIGQRDNHVHVFGLEYLLERLSADDKVLIVDDVFETGNSLVAIMQRLDEKLGKSMPQDIRLATVYFKPERNETSITPDYFVHENDEWIVFPHEIDGLTRDEIYQNKPAVLKELLEQIDETR
ncbi:MAG: hypoxanthine phosphoribosyltransferase [Gammaproteobacteria bacterium]|nr:hypoxanthine phosphoribosyltransferase [Gammaproteobacteria bacterium]NNJ73076.1 hypoxanthine phosphoribosyltransferase [Enterobacterales bacterium]